MSEINNFAIQLGFEPIGDISSDFFEIGKNTVKQPQKRTKKIRKVKLYTKEQRAIIDEIEALEEVYNTYGKEKETFCEVKRKIPQNKIAQVMYKKEEKITVLRDIKQAIWHLEKIHLSYDPDKTVAFYIINQQRDKSYQYNISLKELTPYKLNRIVALSEDGFNVYVSQNTFISQYRRKKEYVWNSSAFLLDLDYYKVDELKDLSASQVLEKMRADKSISFIEPSYTVNSGNGMYLVYLLNTVPMFSFKKAKYVWETTAKALVEKYQAYGADPQATDISRVNRIPNTINQKTGRTAEIVDFDEIKNKTINRYNLYDLYEKLVKKDVKKPQKQIINIKDIKTLNEPKKRNTGKIEAINKDNKSNNLSIWSLASARIRDIKTIIKLRKGDMDGCRNFAIFIYALSSFSLFNDDYETVLQNTYSLNNSFLSALPDAEIIDTVKSAYKGKDNYKYKNETIIELLEITEEEQKHMKTLISKQTKIERKYERRKQKRRNDAGLTSREAKKQQNISIIKELQKEGYKQKEIAERVNLSIVQVKRYYKEIKSLNKDI